MNYSASLPHWKYSSEQPLHPVIMTLIRRLYPKYYGVGRAEQSGATGSHPRAVVQGQKLGEVVPPTDVKYWGIKNK